MTRRMTDALWGIGVIVVGLTAAAPAAAQESWVERAVHNFGEPINTLWAEGELSFARHHGLLQRPGGSRRGAR